MKQPDTVDRSIRNQRRRGLQVLVLVGCWVVVWIGGPVLFTVWDWNSRHTKRAEGYAFLLLLALMLAIHVVIILRLSRLPPMRLRLGDKLTIVPGPAVEPKDIRGFHFQRDPDEDFVESNLSLPTCQLTVELSKKRHRLIISLIDASRVLEWARRLNVSVVDPEGYACRGDGL